MLSVSDKVKKYLPSSVSTSLGKMPEDKQMIFEEEFTKKMKKPGIAFMWIFIFGVQYFYLGKIGIQFLYWFTLGGLWIWALVDMFTIWKRVKEMNEEIAKTLLRDMKIMDS